MNEKAEMTTKDLKLNPQNAYINNSINLKRKISSKNPSKDRKADSKNKDYSSNSNKKIEKFLKRENNNDIVNNFKSLKNKKFKTSNNSKEHSQKSPPLQYNVPNVNSKLLVNLKREGEKDMKSLSPVGVTMSNNNTSINLLTNLNSLNTLALNNRSPRNRNKNLQQKISEKETNAKTETTFLDRKDITTINKYESCKYFFIK